MIANNTWSAFHRFILKLLLTTSLLLVLPFFLLAQEIELRYQDQVDAFDTTIIHITENLIIGYFDSDITDISRLSKVESVGGSLRILNNKRLSDLTGLNAIKSIEEDFLCINNDSIRTINSLASLESIGDVVKINDNKLLESFDSLTSLNTIGNHLQIRNNPFLRNFKGLDSLKSIGGSLNISRLDSLQNLQGLGSLETILGNLSITENNNLATLDGLSSLERTGRFTIQDNDKLLDVDALSTLQIIEGYLTIQGNKELTNLDGLENVKKVRGFLRVKINAKLNDCCGITHMINNPFVLSSFIDISSNLEDCSSVDAIRDDDCGIFSIVLVNSNCIGTDNGSINVDVISNNTLPIYYELVRTDDGSITTGQSDEYVFSIEMLVEGNYILTLSTDNDEPKVYENIIIDFVEGSVFEIEILEVTNSSNEFPNGHIDFNAQGGNAPYFLSWTGTQSGNIDNLSGPTFTIPDLSSGEYEIMLIDDMGSIINISVNVLDDSVPVFECNEPLDIVILNDVSGSVDQMEYTSSKNFFVDMLESINIGNGANESRASIIEWAGSTDQEVKISLSDDIEELRNYENSTRSFSGGTNPNKALKYGYYHLENEGRDSVSKVLILSTDCNEGQISNSLVALANQYKSEGYFIVTIAFDGAFNSTSTRNILSQAASINVLAPGASSYADLEQEIASNIVNLYICPLDPGSSSSVYLNRDGAIQIEEVEPIANCPYPIYADITFTITASEDLSIPASTPISFYLNDPNLSSASYISTWILPCAIAVGTSETYTATIPIVGPSLIYTVMNDDGQSNLPIQFPITDIEEINYNNNIDVARVCVDEMATILATMYTTTPIPACDTIINYTVDVCNISEVDGFNISVENDIPLGFELLSFITNFNGCAILDSMVYDIPAGCCITIDYTYNASNAQLGTYYKQSVVLDGPNDQTYYSYDGNLSQDEDVTIDGSINCPSDIVEFTKLVDLEEACDEGYVTYTFTINNEMNIPLQGLIFRDVLPPQCEWIYQPYNKSGISIANMELEGNIADFIITQIEPQTIATFSIDAFLGSWPNNETVTNVANLIGPVNITSNIVSTNIISAPIIEISDTIVVGLNSDTISLSTLVSVDADLSWTSEGDGNFVDSIGSEAIYVLGVNDKETQLINLLISLESKCHQTDKPVVIKIDNCLINIQNLIIGECHDNDTPFIPEDDTYEISFSTSIFEGGNNNLFQLLHNGETLSNHTYGDSITLQLDADGQPDTLLLIDSDLNYCTTEFLVSQENCSSSCELEIEYFNLFECNYNNGNDDTLELSLKVNANNVLDESTYFLINGQDTIGNYQYGVDLIISVPNSGEESISLTIEDANNCTDQIEIAFNIFDLDFEIDIPNFLCSDTETNIELLTENENVSYQWGPIDCITSGANSNNPIVRVNDENNKILTLQIIDDLTGCILDFEYNIPVINFELDIMADPDTTINIGDNVEIFVSENNVGESYEWSNGADDISQIVTPEETTTYIVSVTDINGCVDTDEVTINVIPLNCEIFVPNAFTPNGDGINDQLYVRSNTITSMDFHIYNRWGEEIFSTTNQSMSWDGTYQGKLLSPDAFAFHLIATCSNGEEYIQKGNVSILR